MSHHIAVRLPDGRVAYADYRQPVVHVMRRVNRRLEHREAADPADYDLLTEWLEHCPEQACSWAEARQG